MISPWAGSVGIPVLGYNFSIAGVASRVMGPFARGGAVSVGMDGVDETPVPLGMVWNMVYDPPMPRVRRQPRLVYQPHMVQRLIDLNPSSANRLEFCIGTLAEMTEGDVYKTVDRYSRAGRVAYVHLRNITGKVPHYRETFIDDGDVDIVEVLRILHRNGFDGVVIPDHTPLMTCQGPWHAGMAFALGFIQGVLKRL